MLGVDGGTSKLTLDGVRAVLLNVGDVLPVDVISGDSKVSASGIDVANRPVMKYADLLIFRLGNVLHPL